MQTQLSLKRILGFGIAVTGILLFGFFMPTAISLGLLATLLQVWLVSILIFTGCSMMVGLGLKTFIKSLLGGAIVGLVANFILISPLSLDLQLLLINILLFGLVLLSWYRSRRKSNKQ